MTKPAFTEIREHLFVRDKIRLLILDKIHSGELQPGARLWSETELADQLGVSRNSVREALQSLEREGYIEKRHGVGTFITDSLPLLRGGIERLLGINEFIEAHGLKPQSLLIQLERRSADKEAVRALKIPADSDIVCAEMVKTANNTPIALCIDIIPAAILTKEVTKQQFSTSIFLALEEHGIAVKFADCDIDVCNADPDVAHKLRIAEGSPLLLFRQIHFDQSNRLVLYTKTYYSPGIIRFNVIRRRSM